MNDQTYINQIGRNLLAAVAELPKSDETKKAKNKKDKETKADDENTDLSNMENLYQLQSLYLGIYQKLSAINPEIVGLPDYKETYPVDKKKYDKCVNRVHRILLTMYAIGLIGEYKDTGYSSDLVSEYNDSTKSESINKTPGRLIEVKQQNLYELCKKLRIAALDSILKELSHFGVSSKKENEKLKVWFANDPEGILAKYHCIYAKSIGEAKPEDIKAISNYFRCDFNSLFHRKQKKIIISEENFITAALSQEKAEMLCEIISILKKEMNCRAEIKLSSYKGILSGAISVAYKNRNTGRTIVSLDTKAGELTLRLNFIPQTLGKVFLMTDKFPDEVFDNIKKCYCKGNECMGHEGVFIPEAGISFCNHIIKYELHDLTKTNFTDFCRLLHAQFAFLNEIYFPLP